MYKVGIIRSINKDFTKANLSKKGIFFKEFNTISEIAMFIMNSYNRFLRLRVVSGLSNKELQILNSKLFSLLRRRENLTNDQNH